MLYQLNGKKCWAYVSYTYFISTKIIILLFSLCPYQLCLWLHISQWMMVKPASWLAGESSGERWITLNTSTTFLLPVKGHMCWLWNTGCNYLVLKKIRKKRNMPSSLFNLMLKWECCLFFTHLCFHSWKENVGTYQCNPEVFLYYY